MLRHGVEGKVFTFTSCNLHLHLNLEPVIDRYRGQSSREVEAALRGGQAGRAAAAGAQGAQQGAGQHGGERVWGGAACRLLQLAAVWEGAVRGVWWSHRQGGGVCAGGCEDMVPHVLPFSLNRLTAMREVQNGERGISGLHSLVP